MSWDSILGNIIADAVVALFFGVFLTWLLSWRNRPRLKLIINLEDSPKENFHWASIIIANYGRGVLREKEVNWHIYWPHNIDGEFFDERYPAEKTGESEIGGLIHSHFRDLNKVPLFPEREIEILRFRFARPYDAGEIKVRYQFSTVLGIKPRWVWRTWRYRKSEDTNGFPILSLLPFACIRDIRNSTYRGKQFIPPEKLSGKDFGGKIPKYKL